MKKSYIISIFLFLSGNILFAQEENIFYETKAQIVPTSGIATENGKSVSYLYLTVFNSKNEKVAESSTSEGEFSFPKLPEGNYVIKAVRLKPFGKEVEFSKINLGDDLVLNQTAAPKKIFDCKSNQYLITRQ